MSETVTKKAKVNNLVVLKKALKCIEGAEYLGIGRYDLYSSSHTGHGVQLPGWRYPVIFDFQTQEAPMDQYEENNFSWGPPEVWDKFSQEYAAANAEVSQMAMGVKPQDIQKNYLPNGKIQIRVKKGGDLAVDGADDQTSGGYGVADSSS